MLGSIWSGIRRYKVVSGSIAYIGSGLAVKFAGLLLLPIWTRLLGREGYGVINTIDAYAALLLPVLILGLRAALYRQYHDLRDDIPGWRRHFSSNFVFLNVFLALMAGLTFWIGPSLWRLATSGEMPFIPFGLMVMALVWAHANRELVVSPLKAQQRAGLVSRNELLAFALTNVVGLALVGLAAWGPFGRLTGNLIGALFAVGLVVFWPGRGWFCGDLRRQAVVSALAFGIPLIPHYLAQQVLSASSRIAVEKVWGLDEAGLFGLASSLALYVALMISRVHDAWAPACFAMLQKDQSGESKRKISEYAGVWTALFGSACCGLILFVPDVIPILAGEKFRESTKYFGPNVAGFLFLGWYQLLAIPLFFFKRTRAVPVVSGVAAASLVLLNYLLVPKLGAVAAVWNIAISYGIMAALAYIASQRTYTVAYPVLRMLAMAALVFGGLAVSAIAVEDLWLRWAVRLAYLSLVAAIGVAMLVPHRYLRSAWRWLSDKHKERDT